MNDAEKSLLEFIISIPTTAALIYLLIIKARGENKTNEVTSAVAKLFTDSQSNSDKVLEANTRQLRILSRELGRSRRDQTEQSRMLSQFLQTFTTSLESLDRRTGYLVTLTQRSQEITNMNTDRVDKLEAFGVSQTEKWYDVFEKIYGKLDGLDTKLTASNAESPQDSNLRLREGVILISRDCIVKAINNDALSILGLIETDILGTCIDEWLSSLIDENMKKVTKETSVIHRVLRTGLPIQNNLSGFYPPDSALPRWFLSDVEPVIYMDEATGDSSWNNVMVSFRDMGSIISYNAGALTRATREIPIAH